MHVRVLGSGAGGGFPQWNCNCPNCAGFRDGSIVAQARTQSSIAVSANGLDWALINASPDIRSQLQAFPPLQPGRGIRDTGIRTVLLIDSQIDHTTGLLSLREGPLLELYCTETVYQDLSEGFPVLRMLEHYCGVTWHPVPLDEPFRMDGVPGVEFAAVSLSSKAPPYSPHRHDPHPGDNIGLALRSLASGRSLFYAPGIGAIEEHLKPHLQSAACLLVDGTFWSEDEMSRRGIGDRPASSMGHLPQSGPDGMLAQLARLPAERRILIHINNTNPILDEASSERASVQAAGVEVAFDGMDIHL
jgi:pyrroloquinoline quinone biosynthesis protein B